MDNNIAIEFENVGKQYRLGRVGTGTLSHDLNRWWQTAVLRKEDPYLRIGETNDRSKKGESDYVWALKDISFKVEKGDVVGIIGKNGAGKSTLLKLLSHITAPTTGNIRYRGRIASLLEVGTGFHPEMTGRENIYMNGSIMGMTRSEITKKLDEIIDFAGVERYIDTPVKRYSSGMTVRLGFAVAAFLEPEILVVDEVLTVGDAEFQKKAIGKMNDVAHKSGRTVLFVSHNMAAVKNLCTQGIVLNNGQQVYNGSTIDAIDFYLNLGIDRTGERKIVDNIGMLLPYIKIDNITFGEQNNTEFTLTSEKKYIEVIVEGETKAPIITDLQVFFKKTDETPMAMYAEGHTEGTIMRFDIGKFQIKKRIKIPPLFSAGDYKIDIFMHNPAIEYQMKADNAILMHAEGMLNDYGRRLNLGIDGVIGLESYK
ncbi:MAG: ABC transporter ATP-binding protein [Prevotellaceae bacterium]|nr:ABC transporter ATP-binding protein [Candidatus Faecinaster equi]